MCTFYWHQAQLFQIMGSFCAQAIYITELGYEAWTRCIGEIFHQTCWGSPTSWENHLAWQPICSKFQIIYRMPNSSFGVPWFQKGTISTCIFLHLLSFEGTTKQAEIILANFQSFIILNSLLHNFLEWTDCMSLVCLFSSMACIFNVGGVENELVVYIDPRSGVSNAWGWNPTAS